MDSPWSDPRGACSLCLLETSVSYRAPQRGFWGMGNRDGIRAECQLLWPFLSATQQTLVLLLGWASAEG